MRHPELRGLAVILAAVMTCVLLPWAWAQGVGALIPGVGLADIALGTRISEVIQRLGAPSEVRLASTDGTLAYTFDRYGISAYTRENTIIALTTTNSLVGIIRGVGLGSTRESVVAVFGPPRSVGLVEGFPGIIYEAQGIGFGLDRHSVAVVMIFRPVGSPALPAAPPTTPSSPVTPSVTSQAAQDEISTAGVSTTDGSTGGVTIGGTPIGDGLIGGALIGAAPTDRAPAAPGPIQTSAPGDATAVPPGVSATGANVAAAPVTTIPQGAASGESVIPDISRFKSFTVQTRYLSLAGYLRYLVFGMTKRWIEPTISELITRPHEDPTAP
jgi:hypothetical protein